MDERFQGLAFGPADILLPQNCDLTKWAVVACDQYTSQPEYWQRVEQFVGNAPSSLHLILPESSLDGPNVETDIMDVTNTMSRYLREEVFRTCPQSMIYVERTLESGKVRRGLVGMVDLEELRARGRHSDSGYGGHRTEPYPAPGGGAKERPH